MKKIAFKFLHGFVSFNIMVISWFVYIFPLDQSFLGASLWATLTGVGSYGLFTFRRNRKVIANSQLPRKDYQYVMQQLKEADEKKARLNKAMFRVRSVDSLKEIGSLNRSVTKVLNIVKQEPARFYEADHFFFYQLDSVVELAEKYTFLATHSMKDEQAQQELKETADLIRKLTYAVDKELASILSNDFEALSEEREIAEHSIHMQNQTTNTDEVTRHD